MIIPITTPKSNLSGAVTKEGQTIQTHLSDVFIGREDPNCDLTLIKTQDLKLGVIRKDIEDSFKVTWTAHVAD
jgi:hypothetical protein